MRVIFVEDIPNVARTGEIKDVKPGYARNYLLPKRLAVAATRQEMQRLESIQRLGMQRQAKEKVGAQAIAEKLEDASVTLKVRSGPTGRLYGAVTNAMVAQELSNLLEMEIDRRSVLLEGTIHELGTFEARVRLHPEVVAAVTLVVEAFEG